MAGSALTFRMVVASVTGLVYALGTAHAAEQSATSYVECGNVFYNGEVGPYDYRDPENWRRDRIPLVVGAHFTADVETLRRGVTGPVLGEIDYTLRAIPNHHRALDAVARYELTKGGIPPQYRSVECWFDRALRFRPDDGTVWLIYGNYKSKKQDFDEALTSYVRARELLPGNAEVEYNLGLVYLKLEDYPKALEHAEVAYAKGYPLQGLKRRLAEKGYVLKGS